MIFDDIFDVIANIIQESFIHDVHIVQQQQSCCTNVLSIEIVRIAGIRILKKKKQQKLKRMTRQTCGCVIMNIHTINDDDHDDEKFIR